MNRKRQSLVILALFLVSVVILALGHFGVFTSSYELRRRQSENQAKKVVVPSTAAVIPTKPFAISEMNESTLKTDGKTLRRWPSANVLPSVIPDLRPKLKDRPVAQDQLAGVVVILDPGNGGADKGAPLVGAPNSFEKDVTLDVARFAATTLRARGATVVFTREDDKALSTFAREAIVGNQVLSQGIELLTKSNIDTSKFKELQALMGDIIRLNSDQTGAAGAGFFGSIGTPPNLRALFDLQAQATGTILISLQVDANNTNPAQHGLRVLTQTNAEAQAFADTQMQGKDPLKESPIYSNLDDKGRASLANLLQTSLVASVPELDKTNGTGRSGEQVMLLRNNNLVSSLIVLGYGSNSTDSALLRDPKVLQKLGEGVATAVAKYFTGK